MHPVEATLYYSAGIMPALLGLHPVLSLGCIADCAFGAWLGHDGFQVGSILLKYQQWLFFNEHKKTTMVKWTSKLFRLKFLITGIQ